MSLSDDARRFAEIPFFSNLDHSALEAIAFASETKILRRGEVLFRRGEPGDCAFVLLSGRLHLTDDDRAAPTAVEPGSLISEMALLVETTRRSTAVTTEASAVLLIPRDVFIRTLRNHPASAVRLRDFCAKRLANFTDMLGAATQGLMPEAEPTGEDGPGA